MSVRNRVFGMAALSLAAVGFVAMPVVSRAQGQDPPAGGAGETNDQTKIISLDLESTDLYAALTLLFKQAKTNYTLDPNLRGNLVTVHVKLPFKQALETVLKASGLPFTYSFENNVYSVVPIKPEVIDVPVTPGGPELPTTGPEDFSDQVTKLFLGTNIARTNGLDIAAMLGAKNFILYTGSYEKSSVGYNPFAQSGGGGGGGAGGFGGGSGGFGGGSGGFGGGSGGFGGGSGGFGGSSGGFGGGGGYGSSGGGGFGRL